MSASRFFVSRRQATLTRLRFGGRWHSFGPLAILGLFVFHPWLLWGNRTLGSPGNLGTPGSPGSPGPGNLGKQLRFLLRKGSKAEPSVQQSPTVQESLKGFVFKESDVETESHPSNGDGNRPRCQIDCDLKLCFFYSMLQMAKCCCSMKTYEGAINEAVSALRPIGSSSRYAISLCKFM